MVCTCHRCFGREIDNFSSGSFAWLWLQRATMKRITIVSTKSTFEPSVHLTSWLSHASRITHHVSNESSVSRFVGPYESSSLSLMKPISASCARPGTSSERSRGLRTGVRAILRLQILHRCRQWPRSAAFGSTRLWHWCGATK